MSKNHTEVSGVPVFGMNNFNIDIILHFAVPYRNSITEIYDSTIRFRCGIPQNRYINIFSVHSRYTIFAVYIYVIIYTVYDKLLYVL